MTHTPLTPRRLGTSDLAVTPLCLGTMTWGSQNDAAEAHAQIDMALARGVNFLDSAEMYPTTPRRPETTGRTEEIIGEWVAARGPAARARLVIASKVTGPGRVDLGGAPRGPVDGPTLRACLEAALRRLRIERVDLYQLHWPNRGSYHFRQRWDYDPTGQDTATTRAHMADLLAEAGKLRREGKLGAFGLSNETAWGLAAWAQAAREAGEPAPASVQNEYSLLCREADTDLAEACHHESVGFLAFSPLAAGLLSGKYAGGAVPAGSRRSMQPDLNGRATPRAETAVEAYAQVARDHGLDPVQMALAFARSRPFMSSVIVGATSLDQLDRALGAADITLSPEVLADIAAVHRAQPQPY